MYRLRYCVIKQISGMFKIRDSRVSAQSDIPVSTLADVIGA